MRNLSREDHGMKYRIKSNANTKDVAEHLEQKLDLSYIRRGFTEQ